MLATLQHTAMAFSNKDLIDKLNKLNETQQSIEGLSMWMMFHRKRAKQCVEVWADEYKKLVQLDRQLVFLYLANHVIQSSRKKGAEFVQEFVRVLSSAFQHSARLLRRTPNAKVRQALHRLLSIWHERKIFDAALVDELKLRLDGPEVAPTPLTPVIASTPVTDREHVLDCWQQAEQLHAAVKGLESRAHVRAELLNGHVLTTAQSKAEQASAVQELDHATSVLHELQATTARCLEREQQLLVLLRDAVLQHEARARNLEVQLRDTKHRAEQLTRVKGSTPQALAPGREPVRAVSSELAPSAVLDEEDKTDPFDLYEPAPLYSYEPYGYEDMLAPGTAAYTAPNSTYTDAPYYP